MNVVRTARHAGLLLATILAVLAPTAAHADDHLALSSDGVHWQDSLDTPLFDSGVQWVPGDVRTASFHVRNRSTDAGDLDVAIARTESADLVGSGYLTVSARAGDGPWTTLDDSGVRSLVDDTEIAAGSDVRVALRVALSVNAPNGSMLLATDLDFRVRLTDASATRPDGNDGDVDGGLGVLPDTGAAVREALLWLAVALTGAGAFLMTRRRVRRMEISHA